MNFLLIVKDDCCPALQGVLVVSDPAGVGLDIELKVEQPLDQPISAATISRLSGVGTLVSAGVATLTSLGSAALLASLVDGATDQEVLAAPQNVSGSVAAIGPETSPAMSSATGAPALSSIGLRYSFSIAAGAAPSSATLSSGFHMSSPDLNGDGFGDACDVPDEKCREVE
ncbi:MAG: hypothetical protein SGJ09_09140 [Phycisphaerae bacterium]|nr:hypothetical protein [Phycisphaerae bacterium]MDZ4830346.1 hypothetical protein [Phycisphaerae bacterium]